MPGDATVAFYDDQCELHELIIMSKTPVKIMRTRCGAQCCMLDHMPEETACLICGKEIRAKTVFFPIIGDQPLLLYTPTAAEAKDLAVNWIADKGSPERRSKPESPAAKRPTKPAAKHDIGGRRDEIQKQSVALGWGDRLQALLENKSTGDPGRQPRRPIPSRR
jgi:hypothetical protein